MINSRAALRRLATVPYPSRPVFMLTNRRSIHSTSRLFSPTFHDSASSSPDSSSSQETKSFRALSSLPNQQQSPEVSTHALSGFFAQLTQVEPPPSSQIAPASGDVDYANRPLPPNVELLDHNTGERLETLGQAQEWYEQSGKTFPSPPRPPAPAPLHFAGPAPLHFAFVRAPLDPGRGREGVR